MSDTVIAVCPECGDDGPHYCAPLEGQSPAEPAAVVAECRGCYAEFEAPAEGIG